MWPLQVRAKQLLVTCWWLQHHAAVIDAALTTPGFGLLISHAIPPLIPCCPALRQPERGLQGHAEIDGSNEWEYDLNARLVQPVGSLPHILSSITNVLRGNGLEQGDSLDVTRRMLASAPSYHLVLMNGDLSYARCVLPPSDPSSQDVSAVPCPSAST